MQSAQEVRFQCCRSISSCVCMQQCVIGLFRLLISGSQGCNSSSEIHFVFLFCPFMPCWHLHWWDMSIVKEQTDTSINLHIIFLFCYITLANITSVNVKEILRNMTICLPALIVFLSCFKLIVNNCSVVPSMLLFNKSAYTNAIMEPLWKQPSSGFESYFRNAAAQGYFKT